MEPLTFCGSHQSIQDINRLAMDGTGDILLYDPSLNPSEIAGELQRILRSFERYGAVSPRMQDGSWLSLPYDRGRAAIPPPKEALLLETAKAYLPEVSVVPSVRSSCALIRRDIVANFGFLDPAYHTVEGALTAFCCRMNRYGYSLMAANHLFLPGAKSPRKDRRDQRRLLKTYPYWRQTVSHYMRCGVHACDAFLTLLAKSYYEKPRILLNFLTLSPRHNGTSQVQLSVLRYLLDHCGDAVEISLYAHKEAARFHRLREYPVRLLSPDRIAGVYHLCYSGTQPFYGGAQLSLAFCCLKNVYTILDMIMCRCDYLQTVDPWRDAAARLTISNSDGLIFISRFSRDDYNAYFSGDPHLAHVRNKVVSLGCPTDGGAVFSPSHGKNPLPFSEYIFVPGSKYTHKGLRRAVDAVSGSGANYITLGLAEEGFLADNVYNFPGGSLPDETIHRLYQGSLCVLFPSLYEGFGLPVLLAARHGKRVIVMENAINRELLSSFPQLREHMVFITRFDQIPARVNQAASLPALEPAQIPYTQEDSAKQIVGFLEEVLETPVDSQSLQERWRLASLFLQPDPKNTA